MRRGRPQGSRNEETCAIAWLRRVLIGGAFRDDGPKGTGSDVRFANDAAVLVMLRQNPVPEFDLIVLAAKFKPLFLSASPYGGAGSGWASSLDTVKVVTRDARPESIEGSEGTLAKFDTYSVFWSGLKAGLAGVRNPFTILPSRTFAVSIP